MYLKSLTLKGFKSFAAPTTLKFEPGICCVVGPNGSGKSNVVDALTWVMGEHSAKTLRGGKMQDVIFAGTAGKQPLGRAEVTLTLDNSDGALPIDYAEVSLTRRMFRDGAAEYEINGDRTRLMDVQELLSDSGIGREMHVIVGQGKLAEILESKPEERRAFIEEAAGILKHRRRKEKAQRKLAGMQGNLDRLTDLTTELRRQLKPLGRQAEVARRAQTIQADLRDATFRLAADDLVTRRRELADAESVRARLADRVAEAVDRRDELARAAAETQAELDRLTPEADAAQQRWFALSTLAERARATARIASDRARSLAAEVAVHHGTDPDELDRQAERAAAHEQDLAGQVEAAADRARRATEALGAAEAALAELEAEHLRAVRAIADRREGVARLAGKVETLAARVESTEAEIARLDAEAAAARAAVADAEAEFDAVHARIGAHSESERTLDEHLGRAERAHLAARARLAELQRLEREADQRIARLAARIETLEQNKGAGDGADWVVRHLGADAVAGTVGESLGVRDGWERAIGVALGPAVDAVVVDARVDRGEVLAALREADAGRAGLVGRGVPGGDYRLEVDLVDGARWALDVVDVPEDLVAAVTALLVDVVVVDDLAAAHAQVDADRRVRAVTRGGELAGAGWTVGGSASGRTGLEIQSAIDAAVAERDSVRAEIETTRAELAGAEAEDAERADRYSETLAAIGESDAAIEEIYAELARIGQRRRRAEADVRRLEQSRRIAVDKLDAARAEHAELSDRLVRAGDDDDEVRPPEDDGRVAAQAEVAAARAAELEARLAHRSAEERAAGVRGKAASLRRAAQAERESRARAARAAAERRRGAEVAGVVEELGARLLARLDELITAASAERDRLAAARAEASARATALRGDLTAAESEVSRLGDAAHRDEIVRAQLEVKVSELEAAVLERHGIEPEALVAEYGPDVDLPPSALEMSEYEAARERGEDVTPPPPMPFVRSEQERRLRRAEKDLATLGKVNPLALEEFAALEERYAFLSAQLDDVKKARADLEGVIDDVDDRIEQIFTEAWIDVEREFRDVFSVLFPGGEGRLVLTEPDDMLATGIEVEARPPGKKVKRLSLLSGGEKSLTAVAMLVAIFKARPSPFYVMDEVEAALDDTNLRRLIGLFEQLRETSQLIVITHQKPTMDVADVLYGVSMQGDGISKVISQRMR
ncbi:chromosome segregation protein SMC [Dietzia sp. oral taxon 368]|uniref:chromosome segregation protein SMC n=1 Tax=Dietzia sp. oral taxon 368 TaxID=712270 RepID=UPI000D08D436|nr:chromosome segregation protein SMC [Dietzia sp. oral taxon 368]AVM65504.1 chromosome segregation protein SMC [Dietzia sp. oral taxon 368]